MNFWSFSFSFSFLVCFHSSLLRSIFSLSSFSWGKPAKLLFHPLVLDGSAVLPGSLRTGLPPPGKLSFPCPLLSTCPLEQLCLFWYPEVQLCSLSGTTGNFCRISLHLPRIPCTQQQQVKDHLSPFLGPWPKSPGSWHSMSVTRQEEKKKKKSGRWEAHLMLCRRASASQRHSGNRAQGTQSTAKDTTELDKDFPRMQ